MSDIESRLAALERKVAELDARTGGMVVYGPRHDDRPLKDRIVDQARTFPSHAPKKTSLTDDPNDPRLRRGPVGGDKERVPQNETYLVLPESERAKGFVRPFRDSYKHTCGTVTTMGRELSETYARDPNFYGYTYCCGCMMHKPVSEFVWTADGQEVGS